MVVCLTGKMPVTRDVMVEALRSAGMVANENPERSNVVVYGHNAAMTGTAKYLNGWRNDKLIEVHDFIRLIRDWDPGADDIFSSHLGD